MAKKTYVNLGGEKFVAVLQETPVSSRNGLDTGLLFTIEDKKGETIGCLSAFISMTTRAVWRNQGLLTPGIAEALFLRIIPHIPFVPSISDFSAVYPECIHLYIGSSESGYDEQHKAQTVKSSESPSDLVNSLVFDGAFDEDKVQKDILSYLYEAHLENHTAPIHTISMAKALFVDENIIFRCLNYLHDDGFIDGEKAAGVPGFALVNITTAGARHVKNNFQQIHAGTEVIVMGDYIGNDKTTTIVNGDGNVTNVKSTVTNSFNTQVIEKVNALKDAIQKDYSGEDKDAMLADVEEIKTLAKDKGNFAKIREMLGGVMAKTSKYAPIGALVLEVIKLFTGQ